MALSHEFTRLLQPLPSIFASMAIERIISFLLRAAELACAAIVAGVNGDYLDDSNASSWQLGRFIYAEVVAGIAILFSLLWLLPFSGGFINWPLDVVISICWWVVFGLLVDVSHSEHHLAGIHTPSTDT